MAFELSFSLLDEKAKADHIEITQKILAIEDQLVAISTERANAEATWRKKENFLNTEKGKLELLLRSLQTATVTDTAIKG